MRIRVGRSAVASGAVNCRVVNPAKVPCAIVNHDDHFGRDAPGTVFADVSIARRAFEHNQLRRRQSWNEKTSYQEKNEYGLFHSD